MIYLGIFWFGCFVWLIVALKRAPEGYEDELTGWHPGRAK